MKSHHSGGVKRFQVQGQTELYSKNLSQKIKQNKITRQKERYRERQTETHTERNRERGTETERMTHYNCSGKHRKGPEVSTT